jgi:hypothetical protein
MKASVEIAAFQRVFGGKVPINVMKKPRLGGRGFPLRIPWAFERFLILFS